VALHKLSTNVSGSILVACLLKLVQERYKNENVDHGATSTCLHPHLVHFTHEQHVCTFETLLYSHCPSFPSGIFST
jgi:hypothetical protein